MTEAAEWLRRRLPRAPAPLLDQMLHALPSAVESIPDALAEAALALYATVLAGRGGRAEALPLLAADALLTHAFQAQAELEPAGLPELARRVGAAGRLGELALGIGP
jgi:hypothetical protein